MSIFESYADKPNQIKEEGQEITLRFSRIDDNTGKLTWNIPPGYKGCKGQGVYNGIVITVSRKPANYIASSPKDGEYYVGDPTVDPDLHSGSRIQDDVLVVGAFYDDRKTTELEVLDLQPRTPYYFSAYAVDNVARYHREGVHSYSLPTGTEESDEDEILPARQNIFLEDRVKASTPTGLNDQEDYKLKVDVDCKGEIELDIRGRKSLTYGELIDEINKQFILSENPFESPHVPFRNSVFLLDGVYYLWDGQNRVRLEFIRSSRPPNEPQIGDYWFNPETGQIFQYETGGWAELLIFHLDFDMTDPPLFTTWLEYEEATGGEKIPLRAWTWKDDKWCEIPLIVSTRNPLLPPMLNVNTFWYNTETLELFKWNKKKMKWQDVLAIYYPTDPNDITVGDFWYNETDEKVYVQTADAQGWTELKPVRYSERTKKGNLPAPRPKVDSYWFVPSEQRLFRREQEWVQRDVLVSDTIPQSQEVGTLWVNDVEERLFRLTPDGWLEIASFTVSNNIEGTVTDFWFDTDNQTLFERVEDWVEKDIAIFPFDPLNRESCDVWWNSEEDQLYIWDKLNEQWVLAHSFFQTAVDPSKPAKLEEGTVWYNPENGQLLRILDNNCVEYPYIFSEFDPSDPPPGVIWKKGDEFFIWSGDQWLPISPLISTIDPYDLPVGTYWLDNLNILRVWDGTEWVEVNVLDYDPKPKEGFLWWNTVEYKLYQWHIDKWVEVNGIVYAKLIQADCPTEMDKIQLRTRKMGCGAELRLERRESVFAFLSNRVRYGIPIDGQDLMNSTPMWRTLGVGDDGSPDERRELHDVIRQLLGAPATKVELSKAQLDTCIDNSLKQLRKYSGHAYKRGFFFLDLWPNQQIYELKDKCTEFHKIQRVNAVYRLRSAFLRGAYSGYDIFGYAALKQLYTLGTFDILSFHLVSSFIEELEHLFATRITFQWIERTRELKLYNAVHASERVLVDANIERTEQDLLTDRETNLWLQRWAVAEAKMALSQSRGKFQSLPGPNGSTVLNAQELITQSEAEKAVLMEELEDASMSNAVEVGQKAFFVLG